MHPSVLSCNALAVGSIHEIFMATCAMPELLFVSLCKEIVNGPAFLCCFYPPETKGTVLKMIKHSHYS